MVSFGLQIQSPAQDNFLIFGSKQYFELGPIAQLVERFYGIEKVRGSNPLRSTLFSP